MQRQPTPAAQKMSIYDFLSLAGFILFLFLLPYSVTKFKNYVQNRVVETEVKTETAQPKQPKEVHTEFFLFHYKKYECYE